jgi:5-methylcytosine-specific restriction endonuclease McrA
MDMSRDAGFKFGKPTPRVVTKKIAQKLDNKAERDCRAAVKGRDKGKCRIPGCKERATELHHIEPRSRSKTKRWVTSNCVSLCTDHHRLRHAGVIAIAGNADAEIVVTGDADRLRFRL